MHLRKRLCMTCSNNKAWTPLFVKKKVTLLTTMRAWTGAHLSGRLLYLHTTKQLKPLCASIMVTLIIWLLGWKSNQMESTSYPRTPKVVIFMSTSTTFFMSTFYFLTLQPSFHSNWGMSLVIEPWHVNM